MSNERQLFVFTPEPFFKLDGVTPLSANLLALTAAFGKDGLRLSNYRLAELFNVERGTVIDNIKKLKDCRYITNEGEHKQRHRLVASSVILTLLDSFKRKSRSVKITPEVVSKYHKTGVKKPPISKESKANIRTASPLPASEGRASAEPSEITSPEERLKILGDTPDSPFKQAIQARRR
jgi:hypothetical protein